MGDATVDVAFQPIAKPTICGDDTALQPRSHRHGLLSAALVAYNAEFDQAALVRSAAAHGIDPGPVADPARWVCIMRARARVEHRRWQRLNAGHRALGDARAARDILDAIAHGQLRAAAA